MAEKNFVRGLYFNPPHEKAPNYVIGSISIKREDFRQWLNQQTFDEKGYLKIDILLSKAGKHYMAVNDYKPVNKQKTNTAPRYESEAVFPEEDIDTSNINF